MGPAVWPAAFLPCARRQEPAGDLFALALALGGTLAGASLLGVSPIAAPPPAAGGAFLPWLGLAWLVAFPPLGYLQLRPRAPRAVALAVHAAAGVATLLFGLLVALPNRGWTGVALYLIGGLAILFLPGLKRHFATADAGALRARLALALALTATIALILAVAVVTDQEERLAAEQAIEGQR